ncbi:DUF2268 domain-containing protein [Evansella sp. AB-rgal1]|uniref:DUF2268 domain-containing protein n=1 Tax=Evansella sp. AB-rgal1 TaxID=3242696 RepID=UPI00359E964B
MPIIQTRVWLKHLFEGVSNRGLKKIPPFQRLMSHYPKWEKEEWLPFLYQQGMLPIITSTKDEWDSWQKNYPSKGLVSFYEKIKTDFQGPDVDVFIFPINSHNENLEKVLKGKNGISFPDFILLFFHEDVSLSNRKALLLHEYHHACRLYYQKNDEKSVTLLESMLMEGLAEWEVKRNLGERYVTPWMTIYKKDFILTWWKRTLKERMDVRGRKNHLPYLFGGIQGFPKWLGYATGYEIVSSYMEKFPNKTTIELLKIPAKDIYLNSKFYEQIDGKKN